MKTNATVETIDSAATSSAPSSSSTAASSTFSQAISSPRGASKPMAKSTHRDDTSEIPTRVSFAENSSMPQKSLVDSFEANQQIEKKINEMIDNFEAQYQPAAPTVSTNSSYSPSSSNGHKSIPKAHTVAQSIYEDDKYPSEELPPPPKYHHQQQPKSSINHQTALNSSTATDTSLLHDEDLSDFMDLKHAVKPVTSKELEESLELLRYDIHREVQDIIKEQVRQFTIAKVRDE